MLAKLRRGGNDISSRVLSQYMMSLLSKTLDFSRSIGKSNGRTRASLYHIINLAERKFFLLKMTK